MQVHYKSGAGNLGEFSPQFILLINFRGLCKSGGAHAPAAPPSSAPMGIPILTYIDTADSIVYNIPKYLKK